jgi:glycosyltransferase involved in cell wall biosynthesis
VSGRRVVIFGSYAPSLINFRGPLIAELVRRGHEVFALAPDIDFSTADAVRGLGATPLEVPLGRTSLNPFGGLRTLRALIAVLRPLRADVMIAYTIKPILLGASALRAARVGRFVPMVTGMGYAFLGGRGLKRSLVRRLATILYRRAFRRADIILFQNEDDRSDFRRLGMVVPQQRTALVNGSGVDLGRFVRRPLPERLCFLMIARFLRDKGIREFIAAGARLKREHPEVRVALVGWADASPDSISPDEVKAIPAAGIDNLGKLDDVRPALADCSVYVLPSYREGTPRSVLEAMATGRAIVTTDAPGCRETVVEGENGFLVPPRDSDALYRAMLRFIEAPELCATMGEASRRLVETKYDVRSVNQAIIGHVGL